MINSLLTFGAKSVDPQILEQTLTVREEAVNEIEKNCVNKINNLSTWQSLLIAPRGSGKTHLIKVLYHRLKKNKKITENSIIAYMSEDEIGISNLTDLLVSIIRAFIRYKEPGSEALECKISEASLIKNVNDRRIFVKDTLNKFAGKRIIILLIENFNNILNALGTQEQRSFRDFIHRYNNLNIIATSQNLIASLQDSENPFYNFFNISQLKKLNFKESVKFLEAIAKSENYKELAGEIKKPESEGKLRAIYELTEGNHRLLVTFYSFLKADYKAEISDIFIKVMNDLKPYYEQFINALPPQQQKIVKHLSLNRRAISGKEIAIACFIEPNVISKQLSLLFEKGMIDKTKSGKDVFYELREPLMRICFEISENPDGISSLFVDFLNTYYDRNILKEKYLIFKYGAKFQDKEVKTKYEQEALMYSLALNDIEHEQVSFAHMIFNNIEKFDDLDKIVHSTDKSDLKKIDLAYEKFKIGNELVEKKQYSKAISKYKDASSYCPNNDIIFNQIGYALLMLKNFKDANRYFKKSVNINHENNTTYYNWGLGFLNIGNYADANKAFMKSYNINPNSEATLLGIGITYIALSNYKDAIKNFKKAIEINTNSDLAYHGLGDSYSFMEQHEKAINAFKKSIELNSNSDETHFRLGTIFLETGRFKETLVAFKNAHNINPNNDKYLDWIGFTFFKQEQYEDSIIAYKKAIEINAENERAYYGIGIACMNLKQYENSIKACLKAIELNPQNIGAFHALGTNYSILEDHFSAVKSFESFVKLEPNNESGFISLGKSYLDIKEYNKAIESFEKALYINPKNEIALKLLGDLFSNLGQYTEAIESYKKIIKLNPIKDDAYNSLGLCYLKIGEFTDAFKIFNSGLEINSENMHMHFSLLGAYIRINDHNKSKDVFNNLIQKTDSDLLSLSLTEDVFYNLFRFGSEPFIKSYLDFILQLLLKRKKEKEFWKSIPDSLFEILINIEDYEKGRLLTIEKILTIIPAEYKESTIPLKMFNVGIAFLKNNEKNSIFNLSKEERKIFKEAVLDKRELKITSN